MILNGGSQSATQDREYPNHNNAPIPKYLLSPETREQIRKDREAEKARREAIKEKRMQREEEKRKAVHEPSEPTHKVVSGRYDIDTGKVITSGPLVGRQIMFTLKVLEKDPRTLTESGVMTIFGKKHVQKAMFRSNDPKGFPKILGDYIEENIEALGYAQKGRV